MKNLIFLLFFLGISIYFCRNNSQNDSTGVSNALKSSGMKPDRDSIILFDKDTFDYFLQKDLGILTESFEKENGMFEDQAILDTALILLYGERYSSFRRKLTEEEYALHKSLGCRLLLLLVKKEHLDGIAYLGEAMIRGKCPCESKYHGVQYLLKSAELNSLVGLHFLRGFYIDLGNYKEVMRILHYMADDLHDEGAMYELYTIYRTGHFPEGNLLGGDYKILSKAEYYLEKMVRKNNPEAMFIKASDLWNKGFNDQAFVYYVKSYEVFDSLNATERLYQLGFEEKLKEKFGQKWVEYKKNRGK